MALRAVAIKSVVSGGGGGGGGAHGSTVVVPVTEEGGGNRSRVRDAPSVLVASRGTGSMEPLCSPSTAVRKRAVFIGSFEFRANVIYSKLLFFWIEFNAISMISIPTLLYYCT